VKRGLNCFIYRPGFISAHSTTGYCNPKDYDSRIISTCLQLKQVPDGYAKTFFKVSENSLKVLDCRLTEMNALSVDFVAKAIIKLMQHGSHLDSRRVPVYHLAKLNSGYTFCDLSEALSETEATPIEKVPFGNWCKAIRAKGSDCGMFPFVSEFEEMLGKQSKKDKTPFPSRRSDYSVEETKKQLQMAWPSSNNTKNQLVHWINYLKSLQVSH